MEKNYRQGSALSIFLFFIDRVDPYHDTYEAFVMG